MRDLTQRGARSRMLDAGARLLAGQELVPIIRRGITADVICKHASAARRTFYDQFETVAQYLEELEEHLLSQLNAIADPQPASLADSDGDLHHAIESALASALERRKLRQPLVRALSALGQTPDPGPIETTWLPLLDDLDQIGFGTLDDRARPELCDAIANLHHGHGDEESVVDQCAAVNGVEYLFLRLVDPVSTAQLTLVEMRRLRIQAAWNETTILESIPNVRRLVVGAAERLIAEHGTAAASVEAVSQATGLSMSSIAALFGGATGILIAVVEEFTPGLESLAAKDRQTIRDAEGVLQRHIYRSICAFREQPHRPACLIALSRMERRSSSIPKSPSRSSLNRLIADVLSSGPLDSDGHEAALLLEHLICEIPELMPHLDTVRCAVRVKQMFDATPNMERSR